MYSDQNVIERILTMADLVLLLMDFQVLLDQDSARSSPCFTTDAEKMNESTSPLGLDPTQDASHLRSRSGKSMWFQRLQIDQTFFYV